jgi:cytochrome c-type biogenesis protein CcmH
MMRLSWLLLCALYVQSAFAVDPLPFASREEEVRFQKLTAELRCLQCQNQNLADSDAQLAKDMRAKVLEMMQQGQSNTDIKDFMVTRYGEFVLYNPNFNAKNSALWLVPLVFFAVALGFLWRFFRPSANSKSTAQASGAAQNSEDW